jgi:hypothetical protein
MITPDTTEPFTYRFADGSRITIVDNQPVVASRDRYCQAVGMVSKMKEYGWTIDRLIAEILKLKKPVNRLEEEADSLRKRKVMGVLTMPQMKKLTALEKKGY